MTTPIARPNNFTSAVLTLQGREGKIKPREIHSIHVASRLGFHKRVQELLQNKQLLHSCNNYGDTPLHLAAAYGRLKVCEILLEEGADPRKKNRAGYSACYYSIGMEHKEVTDLFKKAFFKVTEAENQLFQKYLAQVHGLSNEKAKFSLFRYPPIKALKDLIVSLKSYSKQRSDNILGPIIQIFEKSFFIFLSPNNVLANALGRKDKHFVTSDKNRIYCLPIHANNHSCYLTFSKSANKHFLYISDPKEEVPYLFKYSITIPNDFDKVVEKLKSDSAHTYLKKALLQKLNAEPIMKISFNKPEGENCAFQSAIGMTVLLLFHFQNSGTNQSRELTAKRINRDFLSHDAREKLAKFPKGVYSKSPSDSQKAILPFQIDVEKFKGQKNIRAILKEKTEFQNVERGHKRTAYKVRIRDLSNSEQANEIRRVVGYINSTAVLENGLAFAVAAPLFGGLFVGFHNSVEADSQGKNTWKAFIRGFLGGTVAISATISVASVVFNGVRAGSLATATPGLNTATQTAGSIASQTSGINEAAQTAQTISVAQGEQIIQTMIQPRISPWMSTGEVTPIYPEVHASKIGPLSRAVGTGLSRGLTAARSVL
jgi:hypothetical protein